MNYWFLSAGVLLLLAFLVHTFKGNRFYTILNPRKTGAGEPAVYGVWLLGRGGWQVIGVDLLLGGGFLLAQGTGLMAYSFPLTLFIALAYGLYCAAFLVAFAVEGARAASYKRSPQWLLFLVVSALVATGMAR